ncbi:MAG: type II toxin-antitoxin system RelE/ParE family toxin [Verrucomicrobiota bacterium]
MRGKTLIVLDEAGEDLDQGKCFYDEQELGVGDYFIDCLLSDIASLENSAGIHTWQHGCLRLLSQRFPFAIYYELEGDTIRVLAVLDMRMKPDTIRELLDER